MKKRTVFFIIFSLMFILAHLSFGQEFSSKPIKKLESRHQVIAVEFSPLGKYLAIAFKNEVQLIDAQTFYQVRSIKPKFSISHISISPDERLLAFSSYYGGEKSIRIWNAETNRQIRELSRRRNADIRSVAFSPDGNFIASVDGNLLQLWNASTGDFIRQLDHGRIVYSTAFRFDGKVLASGSKDANVWIWDADKGSLIKRTPSVYEGTIRSIAFSPDGMLVAFCSDKSLWLWDVGTNEPEKLYEHEGIVHAVAFSPDGNFLASGSEDRTVRIWNVTKSATEQILKEHKKPVLSVAFRPDSQILASGGMDGKVFLWERKAPKAEILKAEILNIVETAQMKNIASQKQRSGILSFLIPRTFTGKSIEFLMTAKDDKSFSIIKKRVTLEVKRRAPKITLTDSKFHDGGTAHSKGNQNNKIEQGEQIELHLTIKNEGDISVEQVQFQLTTTAKGVTLNKITLPEILSLQPSGKSQPFIFQLQIASNFTPGPLPLIATIAQKDFPDVEIPLEFQVYLDGPPQIFVLSPALSSEGKIEVNAENLMLRMRVTDGKGVKELNLYHNDDYQKPLKPKSFAGVPGQTERGVTRGSFGIRVKSHHIFSS